MAVTFNKSSQVKKQPEPEHLHDKEHEHLRPDEEVALRDHLDEIIGLRHTPEVKPSDLIPTADGMEYQKKFSQPPTTTSERTGGADDLIGLAAVRNESEALGVDRSEIERRMFALGRDGYSAAAQQKFIAYLDSRKDLTPRAIDWISREIRHAQFDSHTKLSPLRGWFVNHGIKLFACDKVDSPTALNRGAFLDKLTELENGDGVIRKHEARHLLNALRDVADSKDLEWARWAIERRLLDGDLRFDKTDPNGDAVDPYETALADMFETKLGPDVGRKRIQRAVDDARDAGFDGDSMQELKDLVLKSKGNSDTVFLALRAVDQAIAEAQGRSTRAERRAVRVIAHLEGQIQQHPERAAELRQEIAEVKRRAAESQKKSPELLKRLAQVQADFQAFAEPLVDGRVDRAAVRLSIKHAVKAGTMSRAEAYGMMTAVSLADTYEQLAYHTMSMWQIEALHDGWIELQKAWGEAMERFRQAMSNDTYDANGNLIETATERHVRTQQRRRVLEQMVLDDHVLEGLAKRAALRGQSKDVREAQHQARSTPERQSLRNDEVARLREGEEQSVPAGRR